VFVDGVAVDVSEATANRRAVVVALLTVPLFYHLAQTRASWRRSALIAAIATAYAVMFSWTESLSAQLGLLAGGLTWWAARNWPKMAARTVATAWIGACLLFLPASLMLKAQNMHQSGYLPPSARERVVIWNDTAELTLSNPWTGIGANASRTVSKAELGKTQTAQPPNPQPPYHPHSAYLQIWYELGVPGLALFLALGLSVIWRITRLNSELRPFALGQFASVAVIMATSFSLWQYWFLSAVALGVVGLLLVDSVVERARAERPPENVELR
jgi:O-antigen ligase